MLYGQLTHAIGLNDVCDGLRHHSGWLFAMIRGVRWDRLHLPALLGFDGTADGPWRMRPSEKAKFMNGT